METKLCFNCSQTLELKKFYYNKNSGAYSSRCGDCTRKQVLRRYHTLPKKRHNRSCNECEFFTGSECRKIDKLRPNFVRKRKEDIKSKAFREFAKKCFEKMVISQVRSA